MSLLLQSFIFTLIYTTQISLSLCQKSFQPSDLTGRTLRQERDGSEVATDSYLEAKQYLSSSDKQTIQIPLRQNYQSQFVGNIQASWNFTTFSMLFDTTQSVTYLPVQDCLQSFQNETFYCFDKNGFTNPLSCNSSNKCEKSNVDDGQDYLSNQSGYSVLGKIAKTFISLGDYNLISQKFLLADGTVNLAKISSDGVFGLGIKSPANYGGSTFTEDLQKEGGISEPMFSFYFDLSLVEQKSTLTFGGYDDSKMLNSSNIVYHNIIQVSSNGSQITYWSIAGSQISIGDDANMQLNSTAVLIDSSSMNIQIPKYLFARLVNQFQEKYQAKYDQQFDRFTVSCSADLPTFNIELYTSNNKSGQKVTYSIPKEIYTSMYGYDCKILLSPVPDSKYNKDISVVLGTSFLAKYVSIFNLANKNIGFSLSIDSQEKGNHWVVIGVLIGAGIIVLIGICSFSRWKANKNKKKLERQMFLNRMENQSTVSN